MMIASHQDQYHLIATVSAKANLVAQVWARKRFRERLTGGTARFSSKEPEGSFGLAAARCSTDA